MDITRFYELRARLHNTAAAGCMTISEDFRLKRAIEDFKPLSSANKAFEKLYSLCEKLFSEKPAAVLPDCIALADALAVTQGTFSDNAETRPAAGESVSAQKPASYLAAVTELLRKPDDSLWKLSAEYKDALPDPRIVTTFLIELENGKFNEHFQIFAEIMCEVYGKALVPLLKANVKRSGRQLRYIVKLAGAEENEYYRALARDESCPETVRLAAVSALSCSLENGALLAELCNTGKKKVKAAALLAMAEMDAPEAEPIFEKLLENYEKNRNILDEPIRASSGKACTEFTRKHLMELMEIADRSEGAAERTLAGIELVTAATMYLPNKTGLDDVFLELSAHSEYSINVSPKNSCVAALMQGIKGKNSADVLALIDRFYAKAPDVFYRPKIFADLLRHTENKPAEPNNVFDLITVTASLTYIPMLGSYYLDNTGYTALLPLRPVCKRLPDWLIQDIYKIADSSERLFNAVRAPTRDEMLKKAEELGYKSRSRTTDALSVMYEEQDRTAGIIRSCLLRNSSKEDYPRVLEAIIYLAKKICSSFGGSQAFLILTELCHDADNKELIDLANNSAVNSLRMNLSPAYPLFDLSDRLSREEYKAALQDLYDRLSAMRGEINDGILSDELSLIERYIKQYS